MAAFPAELQYVYRCLVTVLSLGIIYSVFGVFRQGEPNPTAQALLIGVGALAFALAIAVWLRHFAAVYVQLCALPFPVTMPELRRIAGVTLLSALFTMPSYLAAWAMPHTSADLLFYCLFAVGLVLGAMLIKLRRILQPPTRACAS
jgi:hypothetical protein